MKPWYQQSYFRNLVDMHIPSGEGNLEQFDAEHYADCMETAGVDTAYVYASNCLGLCLFPTQVGFRHSITARRDIFGETVAALRKRNIRVVGYLNSWCAEGARRHPEWQIVPSIGKPAGDTERFGQCCLNSPWGEMFPRIVEEMVGNYDVEGLWVDMIGFFSSDCHCQWCRKKYKAATGFDLPTVIDWTEENYLRYIQFKFDTVADYAKRISAAARRAKPDVSLSYQCAGWSNSFVTGLGDEYFATMDYVSGDFYADRDKTDVVCRLLPNLSQKKPFEYMISRAFDLNYHTAIKDRSEILLQAYTAFLCGGSFLFIDAIDPDGGLNLELYQMMGGIKKELEPFFDTIDHEAEVLREVAVYLNFDSFTTREAEGKPSAQLAEYAPVMREKLTVINRAFAREHIDYDILTAKNLGQLSKYKVLVLPDLYRMKPEECDAIREFVRKGGRIYASGSTSALSSDGKTTEKFMLEDVFGVRYGEFVDRMPVYMAPTEKGQPCFEQFSARYPAMFTEAAVTVETIDPQAEVWATVTYPFTDKRNIHRYSSAISNPPAEATDLPALVYHPFGAGGCLYSPMPWELSEVTCNYDIFARLIKKLAGERGGLNFQSDESEYLEHVLRHNPEKRRYTLSLLNYQTVKKVVPLLGVECTLTLEQEPKRIFTRLGREVVWEKKADGLHLRLERLDLYDVIFMEY